jgi:hypothetical protein
MKFYVIVDRHVLFHTFVELNNQIKTHSMHYTSDWDMKALSPLFHMTY